MVDEVGVDVVVEVLYTKSLLDLLDTALGRGYLLLFLVYLVVFAALQARHYGGESVVDVGGGLRHARDNERGARLVDQDGVDLVHDREAELALHELVGRGSYIVPKVVEAELGVRAVGDVRVVGDLPLVEVHALLDEADLETQKSVDLTHPGRVAAGQVVVDGDDVDASAFQGVEVDGHGGRQRLALARLHLRDLAFVQHYAAHDLLVEGAHPKGTLGDLPHNGEGLWQQIIEGPAACEPLAKLVRLLPQVCVGELLNLRLQRRDCLNTPLEYLDLAALAHPQYLRQQVRQNKLPRSCGRSGLTGRLYEPVVSITTPVYHIYITGIGAREHVEVVVEELQLEDGLLSAHRLHLELLGPHYARLDLLFFLHDEGLRLVGRHVRRILQLALPAVDLASPEALDLPLELVRHPVDRGVHIFGGLAGFQHRSVDEQRGLGHLRLGDGPVALVDEFYLGPRSGTLIVEEPGDPLHLLPGVALQSVRHRDVAALDQYVHVAPPFGRREHFSTRPAGACQHFSISAFWCRFAAGARTRIVRHDNKPLHRSFHPSSQTWLTADMLTSRQRRRAEMLTCPAQAQGVDFFCSRPDHCPGACAHGRSRGEDVVDQQDLAAQRSCGHVSTGDVGPSLGRREFDLVPCAAHDF